MDTPELDRPMRLAFDIDLRLAFHWASWLGPGTPLAEAVAGGDSVRDMVGAVVRAAYGQGYCDALREDKAGRRADLHRTHGYKPE